MLKERTLFQDQVDAFKDLRPPMRRALLLTSIGVLRDEILRDLSGRGLIGPRETSQSYVRELIKTGQQFLGTRKAQDIRGIVGVASPDEYDAELKKRSLTELNGSLFTKEDIKLLAMISCGLTPADIIREGEGENYSTLTSSISTRLYKRLGFTRGAEDARKFMLKHFPSLVFEEARKRGRLLMNGGSESFSHLETEIMLLRTLGLTYGDIARRLGIAASSVNEKLTYSIFPKLQASGSKELAQIMITEFPDLVRHEAEMMGLLFVKGQILGPVESIVIYLVAKGDSLLTIGKTCGFSEEQLTVEILEPVFRKVGVDNLKEMTHVVKESYVVK